MKRMWVSLLAALFVISFIMTGAMDDEIQEANLKAEEINQFRDANFSELMEKARAERDEA